MKAKDVCVYLFLLITLSCSVEMLHANVLTRNTTKVDSAFQNGPCQGIDVSKMEMNVLSDCKNKREVVKIRETNNTEIHDEEIVNMLENCNFTNLYKITDTISAFDRFKEIIIDCTHNKTLLVRKIQKTQNGSKDFCKLEVNDTPSLSLLCGKSSDLEALNGINIYFSTLGEKLATKILKEMDTTETNLADNIQKGSPSSNFVLSLTNEQEVLQTINQLKNSNSTHDYLSKNIIKEAKNVLKQPIAYICNLSLTTGVVPDSIKICNVVPIYKGGDTKIPTNYRPIAKVTFVSTILEKLVTKRLHAFLDINNILSDNQFAYRKGQNKPTRTALNAVVDHISTKLGSGQKCIGIFLDLLKAVDTLSLPILFRKLEAIGIRGLALDWFKSYFDNRKQRVSIGSLSSDLAPVNFGIPQGSAIASVLFSIYFNDIFQLNMNQTKTIAYADDTVLIIHADTWENAIELAQKKLKQVNKWLQNNLMSLNIPKTKYMLFSHTNIGLIDDSISVEVQDCGKNNNLLCDSVVLERVNSTKYLGFVLEDNLSWTRQLSQRIRK